MRLFRPLQIIRLFQINYVLMKHAVLTHVLPKRASRWLHGLTYLNPWHYAHKRRLGTKEAGASIREALEQLGPIFVKFGQMLSTRRDVLPVYMADELAKLQDQVPPFPGAQARAIVEAELGDSVHHLFAEFDETPMASASVAQVHAARLQSGESVIVKVVRPDIEKIIGRDIGLLYSVARFVNFWWSDAKRLRLPELVAEFEQTIGYELDMMREAASASQLRRHFEDSELMYVPKVYWSHTAERVMVMERISGVRISDIAGLKEAGVDMKVLSENGVEIFFTQVFRDRFFHADMHPGNLFVDVSNPQAPRYLGVDFGIMGSLTALDQKYLADNLMAFFDRDYERVAQLHVESGWVSSDTRVDQFEAAIRTVCEPIFEKPLSEISFADVLLRLFQTAQQFDMEIQPQLLLLQKTLVNVEGLGRELYPELDLWVTAKPFLKKWMRARYRVDRERVKKWAQDVPNILEKACALPVVMERMAQGAAQSPMHRAHSGSSRGLSAGLVAGFVLLLNALVSGLLMMGHSEPLSLLLWVWISLGVGLTCVLFSICRRPQDS